MRHYCTLFDQTYLAKGLALHASLVRHSFDPFTLHILALDMETFWILAEMGLEHVDLIPLEAFERAMKLAPVRQSRSWQEYCWTVASCLMEYLLPWHDSITYLDADIFFFSDPKAIFDEVGDKSIGIVPHRFNDRERLRLGMNGEYNVGVVVARNTPVGGACISRWAAQCREWCFNRNEDGRFGDQAYLDSWPADYPDKVCVIENVGVNLGPWSIGNYEIGVSIDGSVLVFRKPQHREPLKAFGNVLTCYHFHEFIDALHLTNWPLRESDIKLIYRPYVAEFCEQQERIKVFRARIERRREQMAGQGA